MQTNCVASQTRPPLLPQIHWFSIINSCVTVLLLTGFLATILMRVLKNDFIKFSRDDEAGRCRGPRSVRHTPMYRVLHLALQDAMHVPALRSRRLL